MASSHPRCARVITVEGKHQAAPEYQVCRQAATRLVPPMGHQYEVTPEGSDTALASFLLPGVVFTLRFLRLHSGFIAGVPLTMLSPIVVDNIDAVIGTCYQVCVRSALLLTGGFRAALDGFLVIELMQNCGLPVAPMQAPSGKWCSCKHNIDGEAIIFVDYHLPLNITITPASTGCRSSVPLRLRCTIRLRSRCS
jgi:hypothetical protein